VRHGQISQQRDEREQQSYEARTGHRVLCMRFCPHGKSLSNRFTG
jgi:hypothetical protein